MSKYYILFTIVLLVHSVTSSHILFRPGKMTGMDRMKDPMLSECLNKCPVTMDLSPHCASDGKSYPNTSSISCMQKCLKPLGEELTIVSSGFCEKDIIAQAN